MLQPDPDSDQIGGQLQAAIKRVTCPNQTTREQREPESGQLCRECVKENERQVVTDIHGDRARMAEREGMEAARGGRSSQNSTYNLYASESEQEGSLVFLQSAEDQAADERETNAFMQAFEDRRPYTQWSNPGQGGGGVEHGSLFSTMADAGRTGSGQDSSAVYDPSHKRSFADVTW